MTFLADKLNRRIDILVAYQTPRSDGGFDRSYKTVISVWANFAPVTPGQYVRGVQVKDGVTHQFLIRKRALDQLSPKDSSYDVWNLKDTHFIRYIPHELVSDLGRIFRIISMTNHREENEYYIVDSEEIETEGWVKDD